VSTDVQDLTPGVSLSCGHQISRQRMSTVP
jgi:hypothetical protein